MKYLLVVVFVIFHLVGHGVCSEELTQNSQQNDEQYPDESYADYQPQPLGHSRPVYYQQEGAYSHRSQPPYHQQVDYDSPSRFSGFKGDSFRQAATPVDNYGLLGSGNFGVIKGGTFYGQNDESGHYGDDNYNPYFHNGHGRPSYHGGPPNPRPYQHEQFANFRDFADINTPNDRQYSQYVIVYVNKNATKDKSTAEEGSRKKPKNIFESLQLLDGEDDSVGELQQAEEVPEKKLSLSKTKLKKVFLEKKYKLKKAKKEQLSRDYEPLLALS